MNQVGERAKVDAFAVGDYCAGAVTGVATALAVRAVVSPNLDMVLAMLLGTAAGMAVHLALIPLAAPILGLFHVMVPGSLIGMYGGMLFAMRDTMQHPGSLSQAAMVGALFGVVMVALARAYDAVLRGSAPDVDGG